MPLIIKTNKSVSQNYEKKIIEMLRPEYNYICFNPVRSCILHLLIKSIDLNHSLQVEEISHKIGKRHSVVIYHLEQLKRWGLVDVVKNSNHGNKSIRKIWGLNLKYPNLIFSVYEHTMKYFYPQEELEEMCNINNNVRHNGNSKKNGFGSDLAQPWHYGGY
jgi:DNA-binding transcriptional ArsR family regulator